MVSLWQAVEEEKQRPTLSLERVVLVFDYFFLSTSQSISRFILKISPFFCLDLQVSGAMRLRGLLMDSCWIGGNTVSFDL